MNDLLASLVLATLSCTAAIALILCIRRATTRQFGAEVTYILWALVPLATLATLLPARSVVRIVQAIPPSAVVAASTVGELGASVPSMPRFDGGTGVSAWWWCGLWIAGMAASLLLFLLQQRRFVQRLGRIDRIPGDLHRAQSTQGCPALVGVWRPRIVVPADFETRYNGAERELILAHERHHLARGDALVNALATVLRSVFWFNPLVHFATARFMADQELACDAAVMAHFPAASRSYANAMLKAQSGDHHAALACQWTPRNLLVERIARLASPAIDRSRRWLGNAAAVALIVAGSVAAWASQPVQTEVRYERATLASAPVAAGTDATSSSLPVIDVASSTPTSEQPPATTRRKTLRKNALPPHDVAPPSEAAKAQRNPTHPAAMASDAQRETTMETSPASPSPIEPTAIGDRLPRELASYRRDHAPSYPAAAARAHIEGKIVLDVAVDEHGNPTGARVESLEPPSATELASASLAAVTEWRFEPAQRNGRAVAGRIAVPFVFGLNGPSAYAAPETHRQASYRTVSPGAYPDDLAGAEGVVYVRIRIEDDGSVSSSEIDRVDPPSATRLGASALSSLRTWTFNPARERGKAIASTAIVPIVFGTESRPNPDVARIRNSLDPIRITPKRS